MVGFKSHRVEIVDYRLVSSVVAVLNYYIYKTHWCSVYNLLTCV